MILVPALICSKEKTKDRWLLIDTRLNIKIILLFIIKCINYITVFFSMASKLWDLTASVIIHMNSESVVLSALTLINSIFIYYCVLDTISGTTQENSLKRNIKLFNRFILSQPEGSHTMRNYMHLVHSIYYAIYYWYWMSNSELVKVVCAKSV